MNRNGTELKKVLHTRDLVMLAFGAAIGWAWVVLSGDWILTGGTLGAVLGFALGGLMVLFVGMTYSELCPAMPKCGGEHVFSMRALGFNWSFVCSWALTLSYLGVVAFEACSLPSVLGYMIPALYQGYAYTVAGMDIYIPFIITGVAAAVVLTVVNYVGIQFASWVQQALTAVILAVGLILVATTFFKGDVSNIQPLFSQGVDGVLAVTVITPFFMVGFDVIPQAAEEVDIPARRIGHLMLFSIAMSVGWYCLILFCVSMLFDHESILHAELCTADALSAAWNGNPAARRIVVFGGVCGILTSWNAFLAAGSRVLFSMGKSGMLPEWFSRVHERYHTPSNAVLFIGGISALAPFFGKQLLTWISNAASFSTVIAYGLVAVSFLVLRKKEPDMPRPCKIRNGYLAGGIAVLLTLGMLLLYIPGMPSGLGTPEWIIIFLWTVIGVPMYLIAADTRKRGGISGGRADRRAGRKS